MYRSTFFLTSELVQRPASRPGRFTPGEKVRGTHWIGGWVDLRVSLDDMENIKFLILPALELRPLGRPAGSRSLYRLRSPGGKAHESIDKSLGDI
jgi:hypothetical protein